MRTPANALVVGPRISELVQLPLLQLVNLEKEHKIKKKVKYLEAAWISLLT